MQKLEQNGYVAKVPLEDVETSKESWYLPHHAVSHNSKDRIVFNWSFNYKGQSLNSQLLPGPTLSPSLLEVLLRFRQRSVAVSGDIKAMFHRVRLLPADMLLLCFIWRDLVRTEEPTVYEWQVSPFGTTCSPCCATYALQQHVQDNKVGNEDILESIEQALYLDNCLQTLGTVTEARDLVNKMRELLSVGGFEIRQWASNNIAVIDHLPSEARSQSSELWLSQQSPDLQEPTLGMRWDCLQDTLGYKSRTLESSLPKVLVQDLWKTERGWDDPIQQQDLLDRWQTWEVELRELNKVEIPRCYDPPCADSAAVTRDLHVFCDALERAYGAVAYLGLLTNKGMSVQPLSWQDLAWRLKNNFPCPVSN